jgi:hypothetical protein
MDWKFSSFASGGVRREIKRVREAGDEIYV